MYSSIAQICDIQVSQFHV